MTISNHKKIVAKFFIAIFMVAQFGAVSSFLMTPKPAEAFFPGVPTPTIKIADVYDVAKDIALAALRQVAINFANKFLTRFVNKLQDKYKIRNYLYYDKVLTDYYLNRYIADKITDPDLRGIYTLLERGFISGAPTGTTGGPDPRAALIPRLNQAISKYYIDKGGVDPQKVRKPSNYATDKEYFDSVLAFYSNHPSFTQQNLQTEFGSFQAAATTASQLEILVGNALKAGRVVGGTCKLTEIGNGLTVTNGITGPLPGTPVPGTPGATPTPLAGVNPSSSPQGCQQAGGTWQASALDQARSFIDNPTAFTEKWMDAAIHKITGNNFDPNNYKAVLGSFIGNYLFNQLLLDKNGNDTLPDSPFQYAGDTAVNPTGTPIDIDADGIGDGFDLNGDSSPDICTYGGTPDGAGPPCKGSKEAGSANPTTGGGGATICATDEVSIDVVYHATEGGPAYDRLSVHTEPGGIDFTNGGPDLVDDDEFHVATGSGVTTLTQVILKTTGGAGAYVTSGPTELQASQAAGKSRHTVVPDSSTWINGFEPGIGEIRIDLSGYQGDSLHVGAFFRGHSGDGRAEVCVRREHLQGGVTIPNI